MSKKEKVQEEVQEIPKKKKDTFVTRWFNETAVNDHELLKKICDLTALEAEKQFSLYVKSGNTEIFGMIFYATFMSILDFLKSKQKDYNELTIEICQSLNIGYTNNDDEENEKVGNFMPIMEFIGSSRKIGNMINLDDDEKSNICYIRWKELNIKKNVEYYKDIQEKAYEKLKSEYKTSLRTSEAVIPLFCIFMDNIVGVLKSMYRAAEGTDISEFSCNVFGLFDTYYSENHEDGEQEIVDFMPSIPVKLALKSDSISNRE